MEPSARKTFNAQFSEQKYQQFLDAMNSGVPSLVPFRVAETPVFLSDNFRDKVLEACEEIVEAIVQPEFKVLTERAIPDKWRVAGDEKHPHFLAFDFGVCMDDDGELMPQLIELQGFPSLFGFQSYLDDHYHTAFGISDEWTAYLGGLDKQHYLQLLDKTVVGDFDPKEVALMDVNAPEQKTAVDFYITRQYLGITIVSLSDLILDHDKLYYRTPEGNLQQIKRLYNRLIFDEIDGDPYLFEKVVDFRRHLDVEWVTHPHWFYRVSKFTMPFLKGDHIPATHFLHEVDPIPANLENYVLKPLFSFAGQGVIIDVTPDDISAIKDPENWILQQKVNYEPAIESPDGGVKAEIRILYLWPDGDARPTPAITLARLSKGKMIGVRYNKDFDWVGGTVAMVRKG